MNLKQNYNRSKLEPSNLHLQNPQIDWEARRWEMASKIFAETEDITLDSAVRQADIFIEYYKRTSKTINNT